MSTFLAFPVVIVGLMLLLAPIGAAAVCWRSRCGAGPAAVVGCGVLALGAPLLCVLGYFSVCSVRLSRHDSKPMVSSGPRASAQIDMRSDDQRAGRGQAERDSARKHQLLESPLPGPDNPPPVSDENPVPPGQPEAEKPTRQPEAEKPNQPETTASDGSGAQAGSGDTGQDRLAGDDGAAGHQVDDKRSANNSELIAPSRGDPDAESVDLVSRALARGIKAALDFLANEGALEKYKVQQQVSGGGAEAAGQQPAIDRAANGQSAGPWAAPPASPGSSSDGGRESGAIATTGASATGDTAGGRSTGEPTSGQPGAAGVGVTGSSADIGQSTPPRNRPRPGWIDMRLQRTSTGHQLAVKVGPCVSSEDCRRSLPEELEKAVNRYAQECLQLDCGAGLRIDPEVLLSSLVSDTWEETIDTSVGPTVWLHALVEFDRQACSLIKEAHRRTVIQRRVWSACAILGCTLLLLGLVYTGLRVDERLAGRFRSLTIVACLMAAAAVGAGGMGLLRHIAHGF